MPEKLKDEDYQRAADLLGCDVPAIRAVAQVESSGDGFLGDGRIKVLFEGHQFFKFTKGAFAKSHPTICYPKWTTAFYTKGKTPEIRGAGELARLDQAIALDSNAALLSASYGKFQIMGFNFAICGFPTVFAFYQAMQTSEGEHLAAFCNYIKSNSLDDELREHRWADLARRYNGADYRKNQYDTKLAAAYARFSA